MVKFFIVATGYNCEDKVLRCAQSIFNQDYENYEVDFISDGSTDKTGERIMEAAQLKAGYMGEIHPVNEGAAFRRYKAIKTYCKDPETVVIFLGLDDELLLGALNRIAQEYEKGKWMTYGNWISPEEDMLPLHFLRFSKKTHEDRSYRKDVYRSTAPNTFKRFLFDRIPEEDLKFDGTWLKVTTESEVMYSCLEMCGEERIGVIEEPIYLYNSKLPNGTIARFGKEYKQQVLAYIQARPKKPLLIR